MYLRDIENYYKTNNIPYNINYKEVSSLCLNPSHNDHKVGSFSINRSTGVMYCFSCGFKSHISMITEVTVDEETIRTSKYQTLLEYLKPSGVDTHISIIMPPKDSTIQMDIRGISKELLNSLGVYYCSIGRFAGRYIFPVTDIFESVVGFTAWYSEEHSQHTPMNPELKYIHSKGFCTVDNLFPLNLPDSAQWIHRDHPLILTEGVFDALSLIMMGYPAVCNFGLGGPSRTKKASITYLGFTSLMNGFDNDKAGIEGWQRIKEVWRSDFKIESPSKIRKDLINSNYKDWNEFYLKEKYE